jgi:hypothetical protein
VKLPVTPTRATAMPAHWKEKGTNAISLAALYRVRGRKEGTHMNQGESDRKCILAYILQEKVISPFMNTCACPSISPKPTNGFP